MPASNPNKTYTWLFLLSISVPGLLLGQEFSTQYRNYTVTEGLPHQSLIYLLQDQRGFIWLSGFNGIARFDGYQFKTYHPAYDLDTLTPPRDAPILHEGAQGQLWLGYMLAKHKLFRYDRQRDSFLLLDNNQLSQPVLALWQDRPGELFMNSGGEGLWQFDLAAAADTVPYRKYRADLQDSASLPTDFMAKGIWRGPEGQLWVLTESGLSCRSPESGRFKTYTWSEEAAENEGFGFCPDTLRSCLWISSLTGLVRFNWQDETFERYPLYPNGDRSEPLPISNPVLGPQGRLWVVAGWYPHSGIYRFSPEKQQFELAVTVQSGTREALAGANHLAVDRSGGIWSGGFNRGLQRIQVHGRNVRRLILSPGEAPANSTLDHKGITAMVEGHQGQIWLGTRQQGVWKWSPGQQTLHQVRSPAQDQQGVKKLLLSQDGRYLWVFTQAKVMRLDVTELSWEVADPFQDKPSYSYYWSAVEWGDELLGSCSYQGVYKINLNNPSNGHTYLPGEAKAKQTWGNLPLASVSSMAADSSRQSVWLGTNFKGLYEWQAAEKQVVNHLKGTRIHEILIAHNGLLWLGTTRGLQVYDPKTKKLLPNEDWPAQRLKFVMGMTADDQGLIWVAEEKGIIAINADTRAVVHDFKASEWLINSQEWYSGFTSCLYTRQGSVWFANDNGLFVVHPEAIHYDTTPPQVCLDEIRVGKKKRELPTSATAPLRYSYQENDLAFKIAVLHYKLPESNKLVYKLRNFDADWRTQSPSQLLEYPNLAPGDYELLAYGVNSDGYAGKEQRILQFRIAPPWYASTLALLIYAFLLLGGAYGVFRFLLWRRTQAAEQRYWKELDAAKSTLFTNISHEFRTPLTLILGEVNAVKEQLNGGIAGPLDRIKRSGQRLLWLVNQLLELARADSGFLDLQLQQSDIVAFLRQQLNAFNSLAELKAITLRFETQCSSLVMDFDPEKLQHVISNLLHNAIKFSEEGGAVAMALSVDDEASPRRLCCRITDQGVGLAPEAIPRIFDRFYRVDQQTGGSGIGLALTKELVLLMQGDITVESELKKGSTFQIELPVRQEAPPGEGDWQNFRFAVADASPKPLEETTPPKLRLPRLLLIEDNEDLRAFLQTCLGRHYDLTLARDGEEGLDLAFGQDFELIISDVMMPKLDGFTVCQRLKDNLGTSHIPVILLTARVDKPFRMEGLSRGADVYLGKPFDPDELRLRCQQLLRQRQRLRDYYLEMIRTGQLPERVLKQEEQVEMAFIAEARKQVMLHLGEEQFGPEQLANALNASRSQLHRKLQQMSGLSTSRFIRSVRIGEAEKMLADPSLPISQIAYETGYDDPNYFSKIFKAEHGVSPSVYRKQLLQKERLS